MKSTSVVVVIFFFSLQISFSISYLTKAPREKRVCVIGAGLAGLTSARYLKEEGINFKVLEATEYIGGTWRYDPRVGADENGLPIHTSMYKHLRTNLPKPTMELRGYPIPEGLPSYPTWRMYYDYIQDYTKHFDLKKHIKFLQNVINVSRVNNVWKVKYKHVKTGEETEEEYDYIIVGNGHHSKPKMPEKPGENIFKGTIIHSHDYRVPDPYTDRRVLVVGAGPSGMDIAIDVAYVSSQLLHSHHSKIQWKTKFPKNFITKPDVKEFNETGVYFVDGSYEEIDDVIYCTGYEYDYPFLDASCGLSIAAQSVIPLHKYMVNINEPSMVLMGLVVRACLVVAIDAQSRYATALIKGNFSLPSKEVMMEEWQTRANQIYSKGRPISDIHFLAGKEDEYYDALTKESGIERVPSVMFKIRVADIESKIEDLYSYRNYTYTVIDNENFIRHLEEEAGNNTTVYT